MKKMVMYGVLGLFFLTLVGCATTSNLWMSEFEVRKIIEVPNMSQNELYIKTNLWAVDVFNKSDSVIEFSDKEAGIIKGKYVQELGYNFWASFAQSSKYHTATINNQVRLVITIINKDGSVEIVLNNPTVTAGSISEDELTKTCNTLITSLGSELLKSSAL